MRENNSLIPALVMLALLVLFGIFYTLNCSYENAELRQVLAPEGLSQVNNLGYVWYGCPESYSIHTGFSAITQTGVPAQGIVCCEFWTESCLIVYSH